MSSSERCEKRILKFSQSNLTLLAYFDVFIFFSIDRFFSKGKFFFRFALQSLNFILIKKSFCIGKQKCKSLSDLRTFYRILFKRTVYRFKDDYEFSLNKINDLYIELKMNEKITSLKFFKLVSVSIKALSMIMYVILIYQ